MKPSEFNQDSPRGYRGEASDISGHDGERGADGRFVAKDKERKRWTTALRIEALDQLNALAVEHKMHRCEVVELLLLHPQVWRHLRQSEGN